MLSTLQIKSARPKDRAYKLADGGGLFLLVQPSGSKLWRYKFRIGGVEGLQALGAFPEVGLAEARDRHAAARKLVAQGVQPVQAHKRQLEALAIEHLHRTKGTFAAIMAEWSDATAPNLKAGTIAQRKREIKNDLMPTLKNRAIASITRLELTALIKRVEQRAPEVARNLRNHLWSIFEYAIDSGLRDINPVPPLRILKKRNQKNYVALSPVQIGDFLRKLEAAAEVENTTRIAMQLVMLTACRKAEVIGARWSELDLRRAQWEIPAERMKAGRPHWVPLSRESLALLAELRAIIPRDQEYLFPNRRDSRRPMANRTLNALMVRLGFGGIGTPHGMRAAFSTHFNSRNASIDVIEHCLAHVPSNPVRAAYNRHAYRKERRAMLQAWADNLNMLSVKPKYRATRTANLPAKHQTVSNASQRVRGKPTQLAAA